MQWILLVTPAYLCFSLVSFPLKRKTWREFKRLVINIKNKDNNRIILRTGLLLTSDQKLLSLNTELVGSVTKAHCANHWVMTFYEPCWLVSQCFIAVAFTYLQIRSLPTSPLPVAFSHCWERYFGTCSRKEFAGMYSLIRCPTTTKLEQQSRHR